MMKTNPSIGNPDTAADALVGGLLETASEDVLARKSGIFFRRFLHAVQRLSFPLRYERQRGGSQQQQADEDPEDEGERMLASGFHGGTD